MASSPRPTALWSIEGNRQRLDGGAMFGSVPRALWSRWITPDDQHRIPLACRAMLVRDEADRKILVETGVGAFFDPRLRQRFGVDDPGHVLLDGLAALDLGHEDIDIVVLSHLHFDHAGGLLSPWQEGRSPELLFPKATFVVGRRAWERARAPHARDRASFIPDIQALLAASGRLELAEGERAEALGDHWRLRYSDGHTPGLTLVELPSAEGPIVFGGDLIPGVPWVHLPVTMGYDRYPELLIDEKRALLTELLARGGRLFFTHDPTTALARVAEVRPGRFGVTDLHESVSALEL